MDAYLSVTTRNHRHDPNYIGLDGDEITIGNHPASTIFLDDVYVSRSHARIIKRGDDWFLEDFGSMNGTFLNSVKIWESTELTYHDVIRIGQAVIRVHKRLS